MNPSKSPHPHLTPIPPNGIEISGNTITGDAAYAHTPGPDRTGTLAVGLAGATLTNSAGIHPIRPGRYVLKIAA